MSRGFPRLHPALQHHIVNTLGWRSLRPLQEEAIDPVLDGANALLIAPTAMGKTEAAVLPLLSRAATESWTGLSVLYVCPLRALLNNLRPRLERYAGFVGRRVGLWHGDTPDAERRRLRADPPDFLLTTPESLEVMLVSRRVDRGWLFGRLRAAVVDELHAFAGDDRGWHLLSVLERLARLAGRDLQRVGLSATIGNPEALLGWLSGTSALPRRLVAVTAAGGPGADAEPDVRLDWVANLANAANVISRLHVDEKRLVFRDSRSGVEDLTYLLRKSGVEAYASHGSLAREERQRTEAAFAESGSAVIVATSTLELGIDIGDLDRVIQIDAPGTVASFLQRMGRTGRRPGTRRNCLFLAVDADALLRAAALLTLWREGYVEAVSPPVHPYHVAAQQLLGVALQTGGADRRGLVEWVAGMPGFAEMPEGDLLRVEEYLVEAGFLFDDGGVLSFGPEAEVSFAGKRFLDLLSVFTQDPLFTVRHGPDDLGHVDPATFYLTKEGDTILLLAGKPWRVVDVNWEERIARVEAIDLPGRSVWLGDGAPLSFRVCRAIRDVLLDPGSVPGTTERARTKLAELAGELQFLDSEKTVLRQRGNRVVDWWTFSGLRVNAAISDRLIELGARVTERSNYRVTFASESVHEVAQAIEMLQSDPGGGAPGSLAKDALERLKFSECLPEEMATWMLRERLRDGEAFRATLAAAPVTTG